MNTTTEAKNRILSLALALCLLLGMALYLPGPVEVQAADVEIGTADDLQVDTSGDTLVYFGRNYMKNATWNNSDAGYADNTNAPIAWRVVYDNGDDSMTLLSNQLLATRPYDSRDEHNSWSGSEIADYLNGTGTTHNGQGFIDTSFDSRESALISTYGGKEPANPAAGVTTDIDVNQRIVLPSVAEIGTGTNNDGTWQMDQSTRATSDDWWLRSPGDYPYSAGLVYPSGDVDPDCAPPGLFVSSSYGIRPAFRLDLSSVLFTSDASGASKNDAVGDTLLSVPQAPTGAVKLTVLDTSLDLTSIIPDSVDGRTITFAYNGAQNGNTLSAIVTGSGGAVKYYGQLEAGTGTSGAASIMVPDDFTTNNSLQIFVEELHDDYETDYAGTPISIPVQEQTAPSAVGGSGKITGVDDTMEYRKYGDTAWTRVPSGQTEITGLVADTYEVRVAGKVDSGTAHLASPIQTVPVGAPTAPSLTMVPVKTTLTVGEEADNETVATATTTNFSGTVTFSIDGNPLPDGLEIDPNDGTISVYNADDLRETPATTVTVKAEHGAESATDAVTITILAAGSPHPTGTAPSITTASLPDGKVGERYSETLAATGDTPIHWTITGGSLPLGFSLSGSGVISGTPTQMETANFTVRAENAHGEDTKALSIKIASDEGGGTDPGDGGGETPDPGTPAPEPGGNGSSGTRSRNRSSRSRSTPDRQVAKTTLPANAFTWEGRTLTINHDSITTLGLLSVQWDRKALTRGTDYGVYQGSVIVRFSEAFIAAQSPGDHTVKVEFLNHTGETTVTVGETGLTTGEANDDLFDNNTYNPNTGGYPDGSYPATDNPNTGDGRGIWLALLLGGIGAAALTDEKIARMRHVGVKTKDFIRLVIEDFKQEQAEGDSH